VAVVVGLAPTLDGARVGLPLDGLDVSVDPVPDEHPQSAPASKMKNNQGRMVGLVMEGPRVVDQSKTHQVRTASEVMAAFM